MDYTFLLSCEPVSIDVNIDVTSVKLKSALEAGLLLIFYAEHVILLNCMIDFKLVPSFCLVQ